MSVQVNAGQAPVQLVTITTKTPPTQINNRLQTGTTRELTIDTGALEKELHAVVRGEVRFGGADRGMYASDASNYRMIPLGVILPRDAQDVVAAVAACRKYGAPIFARGGGTAIPGQTVNAGVLFDFSKYMNHIRELDPEKRTARVEPGTVLDTLRNAANQHNLTFGPDPA
ncbi:MAG TPA: FAD-binding oxidoreductase, partial [Pyrinomonadaceae bacterium]|nr:FAD-binding oxidoreductase [Pyrinomonadaceae bacterium]